MSSLTTSTIELLQYLLPGFLCAWIFYGFTSFKRPSQFEQIIQALIFTLIIQVVVFLVQAKAPMGFLSSIGSAEKQGLVLSTLLAIIFGFGFALFSNKDWFHMIVRFFGVSTETSYPSEWYGVLAKQQHYVVLHLAGDRRLYGWPSQWPSSPDAGHFAIVQASWLNEPPDDSEEIQINTPLEGVEVILIKASDVEMVEFLSPTP